MSSVHGLVDFLQVARLQERLHEVDSFCRDWGAVDIQEVLNDDDTRQALLTQLNLRKLEIRRFETAISEFDVLSTSDAPLRPSAIQVPSTSLAGEKQGRVHIQGRSEYEVAPKANHSEFHAEVTSKHVGQECRHDADRINPFFQTSDTSYISRKNTASHYFEDEQPIVHITPGRSNRKHYFADTAPQQGGFSQQQSRKFHLTSSRLHDVGDGVYGYIENSPGMAAEASQTRNKSKEFSDSQQKQFERVPLRPNFCGECGTPLNSTAVKFCGQCGAPVSSQTGQQGAQTSDKCRNNARAIDVTRYHGCAEKNVVPAREVPRIASHAQQNVGAKSLPPSTLSPLWVGIWRAARVDEWRCKIPTEERHEITFQTDVDGNASLNIPWKGLQMHYRRTREELASDGERKYTFAVDGSQKGSAKAHLLSSGELWIKFDYTRTLGHYIFSSRGGNQIAEEVQRIPIYDGREDYEDHGREESMPEERRIDPDDGKSYTFQEFLNKHRRAFSIKEIQDYWLAQCSPVRSSKVMTRSSYSGVSKSGGQRKRDPEDGKFYTYEEIVMKYGQRLTETKIKKYWTFECAGS